MVSARQPWYIGHNQTWSQGHHMQGQGQGLDLQGQGLNSRGQQGGLPKRI